MYTGNAVPLFPACKLSKLKLEIGIVVGLIPYLSVHIAQKCRDDPPHVQLS